METKRWHQHYPKEIPTSIAYDEKPLQDFLEENAFAYPKKKALHFMGRELTFSELHHQAQIMASYMQSLGLVKGDRVAIMLPNTPQSVISYYGALMAGATVIQTNPLYKERELAFQLKDSEAKIIICLDILLPVVANAQIKTSLEQIIVTSIKDYLPFPKNRLYPIVQKRQYHMIVSTEETEHIHRWSSVMASSPTDYHKVHVTPKEDLALIQYTGGTTGFPKGVMLTHYNLVANVEMCQAWLYKAKKGEETILGVLPFFHVYGMTAVMNMSIMFAAKMVLLPQFQPEDVLKTIQKEKPTLFPGAPTIYIGLLRHPKLHKYDLSSIKACISGSAPLPVEVQEQFERITGGELVEGYGLTESSPVTHANFVWGKRVAGSIGIPWPDTDAKIVEVDGGEMTVGEIGELAVKGPQIMKGYWNRPDETEQVLKDGWLLTGDVGYMNDEGYFHIVDRKKDVIIAGGYNIYPREVEEVLYEHEAVQEAVVAGIPDPYRGETVKAYVVLNEECQVNEEQLNAYCRKHLAAYKVPHLYAFMAELPKTAVGKILRRKLVETDQQKMRSDAEQKDDLV